MQRLNNECVGVCAPDQAVTHITFMDGSCLTVHWDGQHEVTGFESGRTVTVYGPNGHRLYLPVHRIQCIQHVNAKEDE